MKTSYSFIKRYFNDTRFNKGEQIRFYNFWDTQLPPEMWLARFIHHHKLNSNYSEKINFYSVLGPVETLKYRRKGLNIFFSGENMSADRFAKYREVCEQNPFDLSIGFNTNESAESIRFPLWILYLFEPESTYEDIKAKVNRLSNATIDNRTRFCSLVASHDWNGIRGEIIDSLQSIDLVSSGGIFRQNTDELHTTYNDNKYEFLMQFKFNICPENSNYEGYVTEKLFQSIEAGCIPIYWGSDNRPEEDILNKNAILYWNQNENNDETISLIRDLYSNEDKYLQFINQPKLLPGSENIIWGYFEMLQHRLRELTS